MEKSVLKNQKNKLVIIILSGKDNHERRQAQRDTWLKELDISYYFTLGGAGRGGFGLKEDILHVPVWDYFLPKKLLLAYRYVLDNHNFDYIFTCDDDTYVVIDRLLKCGYEDHMYMGTCYTFKEGVREGMGHAEGGAGFFLSREAIERITQFPLDHELVFKKPSDTVIGDLANRYSIKLRSDDRFVQGYSTKKRHGELPTPYNDKITSHYLSPELFHKVHSQFTHQYWKKRLIKEFKTLL